MKKSILFLVFIIFVTSVDAQKHNSLDYLTHYLPTDIRIDESVIRSYDMTTDYYDYDLKSNFVRKQRIKGIITYQGDLAWWKDVYYSSSTNPDTEYPEGKKIDFLQDVIYQQDEKLLSAEFFKNYFPEADPLIMNLIWDALGFHALAYDCWDSLRLNQEFAATPINSKMEIADIGTFENKDTRITWLGITKMNNKICAIIKYSVMNNPVDVTYEKVSLSGRSHYWGEIYVSLSDKQIEYATLLEDVLTDVKLAGKEESTQGYTIRTIHLSKEY